MKWPNRGPKWKIQACVDAFEDRVTPQDVRAAFEAAAEEEGML
ncbi:conserved hypothetical protein [Mesorhizobium prunaredense]|uniref:DUF982 domain-containing protein n=2 Tax=Mesorhizobium TaxID=68287 RepID=A0A1R3V4K8_9HYPH|nr:conserved hypothetical protein [Mesorhizobium prunaredense]